MAITDQLNLQITLDNLYLSYFKSSLTHPTNILAELAHSYLQVKPSEKQKENFNKISHILSIFKNKPVLDNSGNTLLFNSINFHHINPELTIFLLSEKNIIQTINHQNNKNQTAIMQSIYKNHLSLAGELINKGSDLTLTDSNNSNALLNLAQDIEGLDFKSYPLIKKMLDQNTVNLNHLNNNQEHIGFYFLSKQHFELFMQQDNINTWQFLNQQNKNNDTLFVDLTEKIIHTSFMQTYFNAHTDCQHYCDLLTFLLDNHLTDLDFSLKLSKDRNTQGLLFEIVDSYHHHWNTHSLLTQSFISSIEKKLLNIDQLIQDKKTNNPIKNKKELKL